MTAGRSGLAVRCTGTGLVECGGNQSVCPCIVADDSLPHRRHTTTGGPVIPGFDWADGPQPVRRFVKTATLLRSKALTGLQCPRSKTHVGDGVPASVAPDYTG